MLLINEYVHVADTFERQQYQQHGQGQKMEVVCCAAYKDSTAIDPESKLTVWELFTSKNDLAVATASDR